MRVLVVDDDPLQLRATARALARLDAWSVTAVNEAPTALEALRGDAWDALVTDLDMPGYTGEDLLRAARRDHPETARILITGTQDGDAVRRIAPLAHRVLPKPCRARDIRRAIERVTDLHARLADPDVRRLLSGVGALPVHPRVYLDLVRCIEDPSCDADEVARIVRRDPGLALKTLQIVNSGFFSFRRAITSLPHAIALLGIETVRGIVLAAELRDAFTRSLPDARIMNDVQTHALRVATLAEKLLERREDRQHLFATAVVHDVGALVLWSQVPERQEAVAARAQAERRPIHRVEREVYGACHADIGGFLMGLWGLPDLMVQAVARHHRPAVDEDFDGDLGLREAVALADLLIREQTRPEEGDPFAEIPGDWRAKVGLDARLGPWRALARDTVRRCRDVQVPSAPAA